MRLTAKERVLLHLLEHVRSADEVEVPPQLAQEGVARGAGIEVRHFAQFVRPLVEEGLVEERRAHVTGVRQRRKVYALSAAGRAEAIRLRDRVRAETIRVRDGDAVRERSIDQALRDIGSGASLLEAARQVQEAGILDLQAARRPPEPGFVEQIADAPRTPAFVGRREELAEITREDGGPRVFVIRGIAGIGKSALAAKACDLVRGRRNLFWHRIRSWESPSTILAHLGRFLEALDRPALSSVVKRGEVGLAAEVLRQDLPETNSLLVFDDAHEASRETLAVLRMLTEATASAPDVKVLVLTRRVLSFYDARDRVIRGVVKEIELPGLSPVEAAALLSEGGDSGKLFGLGRRLAGHPLLIELVRSQRSDLPAAIRDVRRFIEETVYDELSEAERRTMKAASLYRVPVPRAALMGIPGSSYEALTALRERSLLRFVGDERYEVHDTIRDFFSTVLTPEESRQFGALAVSALRALAADFSAQGDFVPCINCLSNAVRLSVDPTEKAQILEDLGDMEARLGDFPAILVAYREAIRSVSAPEIRARLHRKIAYELEERGEFASATTEIEDAFRSLRDRDDVERGWLDLVRSNMSNMLEQWPEARERGAAALRVFRSYGDDRGQAEALVECAAAEMNSPERSPDAARAFLEEALRIGQRRADSFLLANVHVQWANLEAYRLGNARQAFEHLDAMEALPGVMADVRSHQLLLMMRGWLNLDFRADFEAARRNFEDLVLLSKKIHDRAAAALARHGAAVAVYHSGDCAAARSEFESVATELAGLGGAGPAVDSLWMAAEASLILGDLARYRATAVQRYSPPFARGLEARSVIAHAFEGLDCLARGDRAGADAALGQAVQDAERKASAQERPLIPFAHDLYAAALDAMDEPQEAAEETRIAIETSQRFGLRGRLVARANFIDRIHRSLKELFGSSLVSAT